MCKIILVLFALVVCCYGRTSDNLKVQLPDGSKLVGRYLTSDSGKGIRAFLGVPYAQPPIGELRFKSPQKVKPWDGVLKAHNSAKFCIQRDPFRRDFVIEGSEDCLYLNVYTPEIITKPLPVMIFFHGGGFMCGSGTKEFYGPDNLLNHDVVYIGVSYRLGPLGFLSTGQEDCWGNFGLKDQVQALRWIQENIASFNGDPNSVTLFGESAGGASVTYHMQSKLSKGLFHRGISQSGTHLAPWAAIAHPGIAEERAVRLGQMMGCPIEDENYNGMIECLRKVPAHNITEAFYDFFKWDTDPMIPFPPVIESDHDEAFISEDPRFKQNPHGNNIPWLTGVTSEEGAMKSAPLIYNQELTLDILKNWNHALPISLYYDHHGHEKQEEITRKINEFYFKNQKLTLSTQHNLTNLYTDNWFFMGMIDYLKMRLADEKCSETYVYYFTHKGAASFTEIFKGGSESYYGTSHAEELQYLFPIRKDLEYFFNSIPTEDDKKVSSLITKLWVNFAYTSNPTPEGCEYEKWAPAERFPLDYLRIGNQNGEKQNLLEMQQNLNPERAEFWSNLKAHHPAAIDNPKLLMKGEL